MLDAGQSCGHLRKQVHYQMLPVSHSQSSTLNNKPAQLRRPLCYLTEHFCWGRVMSHLKKEDFSNVCWEKDPFTVAESVIMNADNGLLPGETSTTGLDIHPHAWIINIIYFHLYLDLRSSSRKKVPALG